MRMKSEEETALKKEKGRRSARTMKYTSCSLLALLSFPIVGIAETSAFFFPPVR